MKRYIALLLAPLLIGQTKVDYPTQVKNGPVVVDTAYATLQLGCDAAAAAHATLNVTKLWLNVPTTHCNAVVNFVGTSVGIEPAAAAVFFANGYTAASRQVVWLTDTTGVVSIAGPGTGSLIYAGNFYTLAGACHAAGVANSPVIVGTPVSIVASTACAGQIQGVPGGSLIPASGQTITLAGLTGVPAMLDLSAGGRFASSLATPQTVQSQWFTGGTDYGARVAAAAKLITSGGGKVDAQTGETGSPLVISDGEDIFLGCASQLNCTILLAANSTPIHCTGQAHAGGGTNGCIVPRSGSKLLAGYIEQDNLGSMAPLLDSRVVDVVNDSHDVEIANLTITRSTALDAACDAPGASEQQHDISVGAVHNALVHHNVIINACGSGIALLPGLIVGDYSSGEVYSNRIFGAHRDDIDLEGVVDVDVHDNYMNLAGADFIHSEIDETCDLPPLPNTCSPVLRVQLHGNIMIGDGVWAANEILGPPTPADAPTVYGDIVISGETISNSGGIISQFPHTVITGVLVRNAVNLPAIALKTHDSQINGGKVAWDTPLSAGTEAAVDMICTPATVPNVGQGNNEISGVGIYNAARIGILNQGCNNSRIQANNIQGIKAVSGVAYGIDLGSDGTNVSTAIDVIVQGNTIQTTSSLPTFGFGIVDNTASGAGVNYLLNNFVESETAACISGTTCQRYKTNANQTTWITDTTPITYARFPGIVFGAGGAPANGSTFFVSDGQVTTVSVNVVSNATCKASGGGSVAVMLAPTAAGLKCAYLP